MGEPAVFAVDVAAGRQCEVMILTGDAVWNHDQQQFQVYDGSLTAPEPDLTPPLPSNTQLVDTRGAAAPDSTASTWGGGTPNTSAGFYRWIRFTTPAITQIGSSGLGTILMKMLDRGGGNGTTVILAMDIRPLAAVGKLTLERTGPADTSPFGELPADGATGDTYTGSGAPPNAVLTVTVSANVTTGWPSQSTTVTPDRDPAAFGTQIQADEDGHFQFDVLRPATLSDTSLTTEDWTVTVEESSGLSRASEIQPYAAPSGDESAAFALRFDFGTAASPVQKYYGDPPTKEFLPVVPQTIYSATRGYGWLSRVSAGDRRDNYNTYPESETHNTASALRTDFNSGRNATFRVDLPDGVCNVRLYHSNPLYFGSVPYATQPFQVRLEGSDAYTYTVPAIAAGTTRIEVLPDVSVSGGALEILFGYLNTSFLIAGIDISQGTLPGESPLLASGDPHDAGAATISLAQLQPVAAEAAARWTAAGLTAQQTATLASVQFSVADLGGAYLGLANPATNALRIDDDAAMLGWSLVILHGSAVSGQ